MYFGAVSFSTLFLQILFVSILFCVVVSALVYVWVDDFDGDMLYEDWTTGLLSSGIGYLGGVSGGSLTVVPYGGSGWCGVSFERLYEVIGDFDFSVDWFWSTGGYVNIVIGLVVEDGSEIDIFFSDFYSGCSGEVFSVRLDGEWLGIGHFDCSGFGTTFISRSGDIVTIFYVGIVGFASFF